ncbi:germin-like protein subfamily 3 member 1 [Gastrolobium bilobum]|uniref:germin-like protein subfamily 3 member 1 n=1 Tax=Gastrolobium bilobum TaxID=150636 RepID=UPI002AB1C337|nr:germin-like protein subfamily 3 member 1 [Gastrolobium bilobum]
MNKMVYIVFLFALLLSIVQASVNDFCVADLKLPKSNSGYPCKSPNEVTVDDFVFSGLVAKDTTNSSFGAAATAAFVDNFPGLNGLGISAARLDLAEGGSFPMHTHPGGTELIIMLQGEMIAGFITSNNAIYSKTLKPGDLFVIPQGQMHFVVNSGVGKATSIIAFSSENPGVQILDHLLFGNTLSSDIVSQTTLLDVEQVKKLKARFGGSG